MSQIRSDVQIVRTKPASNVYTAMLIIATLFVLTGTGFVMVRSQQLFDSVLPGILSGGSS
jgi:hypothetical protein